MKRIRAKIEGEALLVDKLVMEELIKPVGGRRGQTVELPITERYYHHGIDQPFIPFYYPDRCIKNQAKNYKEPGKRGGSYYKSISASFVIEPEEIPLTYKSMEEFGRFIKLKNGNRVWKVSPMFVDWGLEFAILLQDWFPEEVIKLCLEEGGQFEGIGCWRPACAGRFGKFRVSKWETG